MGYDSWLEAPYQQMQAEGERFLDWAEANEFPLGSEDEIALAEQAYVDWCRDDYEQQAESQYEDYLDRMEYEAHEIDNYLDYDISW